MALLIYHYTVQFLIMKISLDKLSDSCQCSYPLNKSTSISWRIFAAAYMRNPLHQIQKSRRDIYHVLALECMMWMFVRMALLRQFKWLPATYILMWNKKYYSMYAPLFLYTQQYWNLRMYAAMKTSWLPFSHVLMF